MRIIPIKMTYLKSAKVGFLGVIAASTFSCTKAIKLITLDHHTPPPPEDSVQVNFCTDPAYATTGNLKMVIVQDHSGSNAMNYLMQSDIFDSNGNLLGSSGTPDVTSGQVECNDSAAFPPCGSGTVGEWGTDPAGVLRFGSLTDTGSLLNFLFTSIDASAHPTRFYSMLGFGTTAIGYPRGTVPGVQAPTPIFTPDTSEFYQYVENTANSIAGQNLSSEGTPAVPAPDFPTDFGQNTSYHAALTAVRTLILNDIKLANLAEPKVPSSYVIVFMSDGSPILSAAVEGGYPSTNFNCTAPLVTLVATTPDSLGAPSTFYFCREPDALILQDVAEIMALLDANPTVVSGINLYTVYYYYSQSTPNNPKGNIDYSGQNLLSQMAAAGHGTFTNLTTGSKLNYNSFLPQGRFNKLSLADAFVTNSSVNWWNDGKPLHHNSYLNGLPDDIALAWGTNPFVRDSIGDGVSDAVKYQLYHRAYTSASLLPSNFSPQTYFASSGSSSDPYKGMCASIPSSIDGSTGAVLFASSEHANWLNSCIARGLTDCQAQVQDRGLNDCEKTLLSLNSSTLVNTPDANGDLIADTLAFKYGVPFIAGATSAHSIMPFSDGISDYFKVKFSLPVLYPLSELIGFSRPIYSQKMVSSSDWQDCYSFQVTNLPRSSPAAEDTVRVDIVLKNNSLQSNFLYRTGLKKYSPHSQGIVFNDWNDETEKSLGTWSIWP